MRVREAEGSERGGLLKLNHHGNFNNISLPLPPPRANTHTRGNEFQNGEGASTVICFWRLPSNRDIIDLIRTYWQFYYSASYYSTGRLAAAKMLMAHRSLLRAIKEHYESIFMRTLTQFCAVVVERTFHFLSLQFCLKTHPGNLEMLSEAGGPNLTGMWLQQEDLLYGTLQISLFQFGALWVEVII